MPATRVFLLLVVFSTLSLVALSSPDGDVQDLGDDVGRRGGRNMIRRKGFATSGAFRLRGGGRRAGFQGNHEEQELGEANSIEDPGAPARCESAGGKKKCPIGEMQLYHHRKDPARRAKSCPDRIGWEGAYFQSHTRGGVCKLWTWAQAIAGKLDCERYPCIDIKTGHDIPTSPRGKTGTKRYNMRCPKGSKGRSPFKGFCHKTFCDDREGARQVCLKMQVLHVAEMSRSAGVLMMKRSSCGADGVCAVFKTGLCIDVSAKYGNVWSSMFNTGGMQPGQPVTIDSDKVPMAKQAQEFAKRAVALLKKHNNKLPKEYLCSDSRHDQKVQVYGDHWKVANGGKWTCRHERLRDSGKCRKHKDATLAHFAILNY